MKPRSDRDHSRVVFSVLFALAACTVPNPNYRPPGSDGSVDSVCTAKQALRCDGPNLVGCNEDGTSEVSQQCSLGCNADMLRCIDVDPSNGLAKFLDVTAVQPDLNLGDAATIDTDTGEIVVGGTRMAAATDTATQSSAPNIRVVLVRSLTSGDVVVMGKNALAVVSSGDIRIQGVFAASAKRDTSGAGAFADGGCQGISPPVASPPNAYGGHGGGGFGSPGGAGGSAQNANGFRAGGIGGNATGNASLVPLRGGCNGAISANGGGAIQLVSRTKIVVSGAVAANGAVGRGGGSGGGILLEAPIVEVSGRVVANGGAGLGCLANGENGRLDAMPAMGGSGCTVESGSGAGGAGNVGATNGLPMDATASTGNVYGGAGGGGVGRIRVNAAPGGLRMNGIVSPNPSTGALGTR